MRPTPLGNFLVASCALTLLIGAIPAFADNGPHVAGAGIVADSCAGCHRAHTAQGSKLLQEDSQTALCYTCHGTSGTGANSDVQSGIGYSGENREGGVAGALRGGGFEYALIDSSHPSGQVNGEYSPRGTVPVRETGEPVTSTHSVDSSDQMMWGNGAISADPDYGATTQLRCGSCHDPHGNGNYRILKPIPGDSGASDPGVEVADAEIKVYTTDNYWQVEDTNGASFIQNIASWCSTCHTRYYAGAGSSANDSGDAVYAYRHRSNETAQGAPNCIQCHVSHGSNAKMTGSYSINAEFPDGSAGNADSRLLRIDNRGTCQMCHNDFPKEDVDLADTCARCHASHVAQEEFIRK